ncbi:xanthine dehydrogenase family protein [bacterium]|nr:xanthine dehydrogenase family protein [bacterium]
MSRAVSDTPIRRSSDTSQFKSVGKNPPRKESREKVTGKAKYIDDLTFEGCLYGKTVRSTIPRGKIKKITFEPGVPWEEFTVVTAKDIPGKNVVALIEMDQPFLVETEIRHMAEPIALIAHPDKGLVEKALTKVRVEYEELPAIFTIDESLSGRNIQRGRDNVFKKYHIQKGDPAPVFSRPAIVVIEGEYWTGPQEQLYIEPNGVAAVATPDGVTVWGSMQCPFYVQKGLKPLFNLPDDKIRVIYCVTGGGFGGKEEYPTLPAAHAALLSWKAGGRPVKIIYDRMEDMWATTKRHPCRTRVKTAFAKDGKLLALQVDATMDGGAYLTLSSVVLSRGTLHAFGPYACDHVTIDTRAVFTNSPPYGAFRGFGAPQTIFPLELHMDRAADRLGIEPHELRLKNILHKGDTMATGQKMEDEMDIEGILKKAMTESRYLEKRKSHREHNRTASPVKKGIGLSLFFHGAGFTGSGEVFLDSRAGLEITPAGTVRILTANTEIGQGSFTTHSQIVAEALRIPYEMIEVAPPDTAVVPNSGPTVASRTCMIVGELLRRAADDLRDLLIRSSGLSNNGYGPDEFRRAASAHAEKNGVTRVYAKYKPPAGIHWDDQTYTGSAYGAYAWACYVCDLETDLTTYQVEVKDFVAVQEVGRVIHPVIAGGQIEGGVAQALGWALYENVVLKQGVMQNTQLTNYILPTTADTPPIRVFFYENPYPNGPYGAKGLGELPMDGPAPAVASAVAFSLGGKFISSIPILPENICEILK